MRVLAYSIAIHPPARAIGCNAQRFSRPVGASQQRSKKGDTSITEMMRVAMAKRLGPEGSLPPFTVEIHLPPRPPQTSRYPAAQQHKFRGKRRIADNDDHRNSVSDSFALEPMVTTHIITAYRLPFRGSRSPLILRMTKPRSRISMATGGSTSSNHLADP